MKVLVVNAGSSSLKYQLFDMTDESVLAKAVLPSVSESAELSAERPTTVVPISMKSK